MRIAIVAAIVCGATVAHAQDLGALDAALPAEADPDAPTAGASLDRNEGYVGDRLALTVTAIARAGIVVNLPQKLDLGEFEILERDDSDGKGRDLGDGRRQFRFLLYIAAYDVGPAEIPPLSLNYLTTRGEVRDVTTSALPVTIKGLVDEAATTPDPQPARSPRVGMIEDRRIVLAAWIAGGVFALALAIVVARRALRRRKKRKKLEAAGPIIPSRPPGDVAIERLSEIRARGGFDREGYRPFAFETAEVVRAYLGARYGFDSLELTSTELLDELRRAAPHLTEPDAEVPKFLERTDLIKFAKTGSTDAEAIAILDAAQAIVLSTAPRLEVAAEMLSGPVRPPEPSSSARGGGEA